MTENLKGNNIVISSNSDAIKDPSRANNFEVQVDSNNIERAIKALKRKLIKEGVYKELKDRKYFEKPCLKRKRRKKEAIKRIRKEQHSKNMIF